jgi:hypothetical protein
MIARYLKHTLWILFFPLMLSAQQEDSTVAEQPSKRSGLFKGLIIAGFNATQVDGDGAAGYYKFGANAGVGTLIRFHKRWSTSIELIYNMKGARSTNKASDKVPRVFNNQYDYMEVPISINIHDKQIFMFSAGISVGALVRYKQFDQDSSLVTTMAPKRINVDAFAGVTVFIKNIIGINPRFSYSINTLKPGLGNAKGQRHNVLTLRVFYVIGNKVTARKDR